MDRRDAIKRATLLSGLALTAPFATAVLSGCQATEKRIFASLILNEDQIVTIESISRVILPSEPGSPGAEDLGLAEFVDRMVKDCLSQQEQAAFTKGLDNLSQEISDTSGSSADKAGDKALVTFLEQKEKEAYAAPASDLPFYRQLKQLLVFGYLTSEQVMTTQLDYHAIPGRYDSCIPYEGQNAYVDNNV